MAIDPHTQHIERELPSPSGVAQRVLLLLSEERVTTGALAHALGADPAMAGRVLKLANTAAQGARSAVLALPDALQRIGFSSLRQVLLSFALVDRYRQGHCAGFDYAAFWSQSLASAVAARHLATLAGLPAPAECFTLGLMARLGELALATVYPHAYGPVHRELVGQPSERVRQIEQTHFATERYALAERLLREWQVPETLAQAVRASAEPTTSGLLPQSMAMKLARVLQVAVHIGDLCAELPPAPPFENLHHLRKFCESAGLSVQAINERLPVMLKEWREWGSALGLELVGVPAASLDPTPVAEVIPFPRPSAEETRRVPGVIEDPPSDQDAANLLSGGAGQGAAAMRILIAHPDPGASQNWISLMHSQRHQLRCCHRGDHALTELLREPPQVLLCDLDLHGIASLDLLRSVRSHRSGRQIYVIAMAPRTRTGALEAAFAAGADDFLGYPVQAGELLARLRAARRFIDMQDQLLADREEVRELAARLAMVNSRLETDAETDALTGIANRRRATDHLVECVEQAERSGQPLGVLLIDLDHFKQINDTWGHATGDEVLREAARALEAYSRHSDLVARFGGEEFLVVAPGTSAASAAALAERLRAGVGRLRVRAGLDEIAVTFSAGVSIYDPATSGRRRAPEALLHMADEALYRAKDSGRNRVCVAADRPAARAD